MVATLKKLWSDESGATAVEYGLMVALIAVAIIATVTLLGQTLDGKFGEVEQAIDAAGAGDGGGAGG